MSAGKGPLASQFESSLLKIMAEFKATNDFRHAQTKGNVRETPIRELFEEILPEPYRAVGGEIIDVRGNRSRQHDVIIYNSHKNSAFYDGDSALLAAEAALIVAEVKTKLTTDELHHCFIAANKLKQLYPLNRPASRDASRADAKSPGFRYFYCIFAYSSSLNEANWLQKEFSRISQVAKNHYYKTIPIDRVYVADRGIIMPSEKRGREETQASGEGLMEFVLHAMNFCLREDARRPPVDYVNYTKSKVRSWKSLEEKTV